ncbi:hypothetical protein ACWNXI_03275 [Caldibacillus thermoamylovorans]
MGQLLAYRLSISTGRFSTTPKGGILSLICSIYALAAAVTPYAVPAFADRQTFRSVRETSHLVNRANSFFASFLRFKTKMTKTTIITIIFLFP